MGEVVFITDLYACGLCPSCIPIKLHNAIWSAAFYLAAYRAHFSITIIAILPSGSLQSPFLHHNYSHTPIWQLTGPNSPIQLYPYSHLAAYRAHLSNTIITILPSGSLQGPFIQYNYNGDYFSETSLHPRIPPARPRDPVIQIKPQAPKARGLIRIQVLVSSQKQRNSPSAPSHGLMVSAEILLQLAQSEFNWSG